MITRAILKYNTIGYRLIDMPIQYKSSNKRRKKFNDYDTKLTNSISRAKKTIFELVANNDFKYFVTLTFNDTLNDYDIDEIRRYVTQMIRDIRKKYKLDFKYLFIPEKHKKGDWHLHGFLTEDFEVDFFINDKNYLDWKSFVKFGQCNISKIRNYEASCKYLTKYITKDLYDVAKGKHLYYCSNELKRSVKYLDFLVRDNQFDADFENDYVRVKDIPIENIDIEVNRLCEKFYDTY